MQKKPLFLCKNNYAKIIILRKGCCINIKFQQQPFLLIESHESLNQYQNTAFRKHNNHTKC